MDVDLLRAVGGGDEQIPGRAEGGHLHKFGDALPPQNLGIGVEDGRAYPPGEGPESRSVWTRFRLTST